MITLMTMRMMMKMMVRMMRMLVVVMMMMRMIINLSINVQHIPKIWLLIIWIKTYREKFGLSFILEEEKKRRRQHISIYVNVNQPERKCAIYVLRRTLLSAFSCNQHGDEWRTRPKNEKGKHAKRFTVVCRKISNLLETTRWSIRV